MFKSAFYPNKPFYALSADNVICLYSCSSFPWHTGYQLVVALKPLYTRHHWCYLDFVLARDWLLICVLQIRLHALIVSHPGSDYPLCRLYHGRGLPPLTGAPINCQIFTTLCRSRNVTLTTKNGRQLFGRRKGHPERKNSGYAYEKRVLAGRWYGAPEWLIRPCSYQLCFKICNKKNVIIDVGLSAVKTDGNWIGKST